MKDACDSSHEKYVADFPLMNLFPGNREGKEATLSYGPS